MKKTLHQLTQNTKLLQKAVLNHNDKILILKREENAGSRPLAWDLPGGNSEWPETSENKENLHKSDVAREVLEETGINLSADQFLTENLVDFRTFFEAQKQVFSIIVGWIINLEDDFDEKSIALSHEHVEYKWITLDQLDSFDFGSSKGEFVKEIIRSSFGKIYK